MEKLNFKNRAQSFVGYALLLVVIVGALVAMRSFMTRSLQEKFRQAADVFGEGAQYEKGGLTTVTVTAKGFSNGPEITPERAVGTCSYALWTVKNLQTEIETLTTQAAGYEKQAQDIDNALAGLGSNAGGGTMKENATYLKQEAEDCRTQIKDDNDKIEKLKDPNGQYAKCFSEGN